MFQWEKHHENRNENLRHVIHMIHKEPMLNNGAQNNYTQRLLQYFMVLYNPQLLNL